jgi:hypothetical protein
MAGPGLEPLDPTPLESSALDGLRGLACLHVMVTAGPADACDRLYLIKQPPAAR